MNRGIVVEVFALHGVRLGQSFAYITDEVAGEAVRPLLANPPSPGTIIEVEYGTGKPQTKLYRSEGSDVSGVTSEATL